MNFFFLLHDFLLIIISVIFKVFGIINPFEKKDKLNKVKNIAIIANYVSLKKRIKKISKPKKNPQDVYALNYFFHIYLFSKVAEKLGIKLLNNSKMSYIDSIKRPKS